MKKNVFLSVLLALCMAGCCLPSGEPPKGDLVSNRVPLRTQAEIAEHLATKLSLFMLEKHSNCAWMLTADEEALPLTAAAVRECALLGCPRVKNAPLQLRGESLPDVWRYTFYENGAAVWSETYPKLEKK